MSEEDTRDINKKELIRQNIWESYFDRISVHSDVSASSSRQNLRPAETKLCFQEIFEAKFKFDTEFSQYKLLLESLEKIRNHRFEDDKTTLDVIKDFKEIYLNNVEIQAQKFIELDSLDNSCSLDPNISVPSQYMSVVKEMFEHDVLIYMYKDSLNTLVTLLEQLLKKVDEDEDLINIFKKKLIFYIENTNVKMIEKSIDKSVNCGLKFKILADDINSDNLKKEISMLETELSISISHYVKKYQNMFEFIKNVTAGLTKSIHSSIVEEKESEDVINSRNSLKNLTKVTNQEGMTIPEVDMMLLAVYDMNFYGNIWKNKHDTDVNQIKLIFDYFEEDNFSSAYVEFHLRLATLLENVDSKSFEWNLALKYLKHIAKKDTKDMKKKKKKFQLPNEKKILKNTVEDIDNFFYAEFFKNIKSVIWNMVINNTHEKEMPVLKEQLLRLLSGRPKLCFDLYLQYYLQFQKLVSFAVDVNLC